MMINRLPFFYFLLFIATTMSSCEVVGGIFKAGIWTGLILVALFIGVIVWVISRIGGGSKS